MGHQIVKQPNGKYAVWSTVVDDFVIVDANVDEIIEDFVDYEKRKITKKVTDVVTALENGERPYYQFTKTFDGCVETIRLIHGYTAESLKHFDL